VSYELDVGLKLFFLDPVTAGETFVSAGCLTIRMMCTSSVDESELVRSAQSGDSQAFGELVLAYQRFAYNLALRALGDPHEAQDMTQEAFLRAWQYLPGFRGAAKFRTWLYRIVMNLCYNRSPQLKRQLAQLQIEDEPDELRPLDDSAGWNRNTQDKWMANSHDPQKELEAGELRSLIHQQIDQLPTTYRLLVLLRYQQDLSYDEIAQVMGMPLGTVKTDLHRAHSRLRAALMETGVKRGLSSGFSGDPG